MAAPSYTSDLTAGLVTDAETGTWAELTGYTAGSAVTMPDGDYYIQGAGCATQSSANKTGLQVGMAFDYGSDLYSSMPTGSGKCFFSWLVFLAGNAIDTWDNGGIRFGVGSANGDMRMWKAVGSNYGRNPFGGWQNIAVDPAGTPDYTIGTPTANTYRWFGSLLNLVGAVSKGNLHGVDAIRYGRGLFTVTGGEAGNYATFVGMANTNDSQSNRWGLFGKRLGVYLWKGLMYLGTSGTGGSAVNFVDSNRVVIIDDTPRTYQDFNKIQVYHTGTYINWNNISFLTAVSSGTLSPGNFEAVADANINWDGCSFQNMGTFSFKKNSSITNSIFFGCKQITSGGGLFNGTKVLVPNVGIDSSAFVWNYPANPDGYLDNMTFSKGSTAHHAINFGTSAPTTITLRGITFSNFNTSNGQNDSVLYVSLPTGTVTVQSIECVGTVSYKSAGATVNVTQGVITKITVKDIDTSSIIAGARVLLKVSDDSNFPYNDTVTISGSGTTATVLHPSHGLVSGDNIVISGISADDDYNGAFQITVVDGNSYTYATSEALDVPFVSGTATMAIINGTTNGSGEISDQRPLSFDQPVIGWVRSASGSPYYKQQPISEIIDSSSGKDFTVLLIKDE